MRNFQNIVFIRTQTYGEIFKSLINKKYNIGIRFVPLFPIFKMNFEVYRQFLVNLCIHHQYVKLGNMYSFFFFK